MRAVLSESRETLPPRGSLGPRDSLAPCVSPRPCARAGGSLSRIGRVTRARFPIPRQRRIRHCANAESAREVIDLLQFRQGRVRRHSQLREASSLRHDLALERAHRGVVGLHRGSKPRSDTPEMGGEVSKPPIQLLTQLSNLSSILGHSRLPPSVRYGL